MLAHLLAATGLLTLLTIVPGPDMAVVTRQALVGGRADAFRAAAGVVAGLSVWASLAVLGLTALLVASPTAYLVMKVLGIAYLTFLGVQALRGTGGHPGPATAATPQGKPFLTGLTTNLVNPKIAVFYSALLPTLAPPSLDPPVGPGRAGADPCRPDAGLAERVCPRAHPRTHSRRSATGTPCARPCHRCRPHRVCGTSGH